MKFLDLKNFRIAFYRIGLHLLFVFIIVTLCTNKLFAEGCNCDYVITHDQVTVDAAALQISAGSIVCIESGRRDRLILRNFIGQPGKPIIIKNCGGKVVIGGPDINNGILFNNSKYFRLTGTGDNSIPYGIHITETKDGSQGVAAVAYCSNFEIDHLEIEKVGFAGIMAKTDPTCSNNNAERPNFTMHDISIHNNYIHDIKGEGVYLGNSFYTGTSVYCDYMQYPHEIKGVRVFQNIFENTGYESIQVGSAVSDCEIFNNQIYNYGTLNISAQNNGIQIGKGTTGKVYNNFIKKGMGAGIMVQGIGNNVIFNNVILESQIEAIHITTRPTPLSTDIVSKGFLGGVYILNNTIGNCPLAIKESVNEAKKNVFFNNIIFNVLEKWSQFRSDTEWDISHNLINPDLKAVGFRNISESDFNLLKESIAVDKGKDVSLYGINIDFGGVSRPFNNTYDIGAFEYSVETNISPISNAGPDRAFQLPINEILITGSGTDQDGYILSYLWEKVSGPNVVLTNKTSPVVKLSGFSKGEYIFRLTVIDNKGDKAFDEVKITVLPEASISAPSNLSLVSKSTGSVSLLWKDLSDNEDGFELYYFVDNKYVLWKKLPKNTTTATITDLACGKEYKFRARAYNATTFSGYSNELTTTTNTLAKPSLNVTGTISICSSESTLLSAISDYKTYAWSSNQTTKSIKVTESGEYRLKVADANGCWSAYSDKVAIVVHNQPAKPTISYKNNVICTGESIDLTAPQGYLEYEWSDGSRNQKLTVNKPGDYFVKIKSSNGCWSQFSETVKITVSDVSLLPVIKADKANLCPGETVTLKSEQKYNKYLWSTGETTESITISKSGGYYVQVSQCDNGWSPQSNIVQIVVQDMPEKFILEYQGDSLFVNAVNDYEYEWLLDGKPIPNSDISCIFPMKEGIYSAVLYDGQCHFEAGSYLINTIKENAFFVYPNPHQGQFKISLPGKKLSDYQLIIQNVLNAEVLKLNLPIALGNVSELDIDMLHHKKGTYLVILVSELEVLVRKIIYQ